MLVGNQVPYRKRHRVTTTEQAIWQAHRQNHIDQAKTGLDVKETLYYVRHPGWQWNADIKN